MATAFPATEKSAFGTKLAFETWRRLLQRERNSTNQRVSKHAVEPQTSTLMRLSASAKNSSETATILPPRARLESSATD